jgi:hypothetical protein
MNKALLLTTLTAGLSLALITSANAQTFGGSATGAQVTVPTTGTTVRAATGSLSTSGGTADASLMVADIPSAITGGAASLSAGQMHSAISGITATHSESSSANLNLSVSGNQITADFLMARSFASCPAAVSGDVQVSNLVINGQSITVTGAANQTIALPNGTVVINKQSSSVSPPTATATISAIYVHTQDTITGQALADVWVANVSAEITCQGGAPSAATSTTGGGWLPPTDGTRATFGVALNTNTNGSTLSGHLEYKDHALGLTVHSITIETIVPGSCVTTASGQADTNLYGTQHFDISLTDGGEGQPSPDAFSITLPTVGYSRGGSLAGGNIQVHDRTCP